MQAEKIMNLPFSQALCLIKLSKRHYPQRQRTRTISRLNLPHTGSRAVSAVIGAIDQMMRILGQNLQN